MSLIFLKRNSQHHDGKIIVHDCALLLDGKDKMNLCFNTVAPALIFGPTTVTDILQTSEQTNFCRKIKPLKIHDTLPTIVVISVDLGQG